MEMRELPWARNRAEQTLYMPMEGSANIMTRKYVCASCMTSASIFPKTNGKRPFRKSRPAAASVTENTETVYTSCFAAREERSGRFLPMYWAQTTAPPVDSAENRLLSKIWILSTNETPETAASPSLPTMTMSAIPTVSERNCSAIRGQIRSSKSRLLNIGRIAPPGVKTD